mmetsp:Transcript_60387/g.82854  ORF Transcript_60387/g.82854 Transcript_60387/m.82854 type:complete len:80 (+) Transcript_60387:362-601(+)|eukprot:CAMPEP_0185763382 /NCGR_PEP_ID=MMETSP1174-20130828/22319_1 /TAXON_ID=35687 /ORGANISM="Dictyocha speculum, Strain CCMP1381" /LENGTH=79 /DNA_ID=CAMNT_0028445473 /DNA_START=358 /DNA_END=597 /DNA_ORIENTATION=+
MRKLLPLPQFAIKAFLAWEALDAAERRKTKAFGSGKYRLDEDPGRRRLEGGGIGTAEIREVISKLLRGVVVLQKSLGDE